MSRGETRGDKTPGGLEGSGVCVCMYGGEKVCRYVRKVCVSVYDLTAGCESGRNAAGGGSLDVMTCSWGDSRRG